MSKEKEMSEEWHQIQVVRWCRSNQIKYPALQMLSASLNGVRLSKHLALKSKKLGMAKGFPDLFIAYPSSGYHGLFIELKNEIGRPTKEQKTWIQKLTEFGYLAKVEHGYKNAIQTIQDYLS